MTRVTISDYLSKGLRYVLGRYCCSISALDIPAPKMGTFKEPVLNDLSVDKSHVLPDLLESQLFVLAGECSLQGFALASIAASRRDDMKAL